jgi:hypothetical protein
VYGDIFLCSPTACLKWSADRIEWSKSLARISVVELRLGAGGGDDDFGQARGRRDGDIGPAHGRCNGGVARLRLGSGVEEAQAWPAAEEAQAWPAAEEARRTVRQAVRTTRRGQVHGNRGKTLDLVCSLSLEWASTVSVVTKLPDIWNSNEVGPRMKRPFGSFFREGI